MAELSAGLRARSNVGFDTGGPPLNGASSAPMLPTAMDENFAREHHVFWMLVKGSRDHPVGRVYLAIQAALAYDRDRVDAGWLMGEMMARGQRTAGSADEDIGAGGLAYFHWLYEVELVAAGEGDQHEYRFRRHHDGKQTVVLLRTARNPRSLHYQQAYERERRTLEKRRQRFLAALGRHRAERLSGQPEVPGRFD